MKAFLPGILTYKVFVFDFGRDMKRATKKKLSTFGILLL